jgi:cytochrome P450
VRSPSLIRTNRATDLKTRKHKRAILRPQFARDILQDLETEERHHRSLLAHLPVRSDGWTDRGDLQPLFSRLTMDSSTELLFGQSTDSQTAALRSDWIDQHGTFNEAYERGLTTVGIRNFLEDLHWLYTPRHYKEDCKTVHAFVDNFVHQGLARAERASKDPSAQSTKYCFLDELVKETRNPTALRDDLLNILLAGRDTTSSLLGWTFHLLAQHPAIFTSLRQTILTDFGTYNNPHNLDFTSIKACSTLQHVLSETLRLYPPIPGNERFAAKDTTLPTGGGPNGTSPIYVRKGQSVAYFVGAMHRRKDLWGDDANEFRPDRWIERRPKWDYLPFSGGPRICLGQQQALVLAGFNVIRLLQRFDAIRPEDQAQRVRHHLTLTDAPRFCWVSLREAKEE